ncbi:hypothetical protein OG909_08295 [Streptomyces sp. NBC_01754]|uniref:hypothetical protein n=1 Tax=Streptomyces sp. NBC_01754 TaxID=2975930 RepID=UPI002DDA7D22|nr:hypothetical protein [Streptomyces sp. NBC_01754]WSC92294.1 hypothetical protein OG909_08295 [Streptomyces sp. NBC_01754]
MRSHEYDQQFRDRATRIRAWGLGLLCVAAVLWIWAAKELLIPNRPDLEEVVTLLGASVPVSIAGIGVFTIGTVSRRMSAHAHGLRELDKLAQTREG